MKELRIRIGLAKGEKRSKEEKELLEDVMCVLARVVDKSLYTSVMYNKLDEDHYLETLERILTSFENREMEIAKEQLYMLAVLLDKDAEFILKNMVYPNEDALAWFFQYFCEHLIDYRVMEKMLVDAEYERDNEEYFKEVGLSEEE